MEFDKKINPYLHDELSDEELNEFLLHLASCPKCSEELEINYIVNEGIRRLDREKADYNLSLAYTESTENSRRYLARRKGTIRLSYIIGTLTFWCMLMVVFVYLRILIMGS